MKHILIASLVAGSLTITLNANAAPNNPHMRPIPPSMQIVKSLHGLSLTDEQIAQVKQILAEFKDNNEPPTRPQAPNLDQLLTASESEIRAHVESQLSENKSRKMALAELRSNVYSLLTSGQKELLEQRELRRNTHHEKIQKHRGERDNAMQMDEQYAANPTQRRIPRLPFKDIELSDEQLTSLHTINETYKDKKEQQRATIKGFRDAEKSLIRSGNFSQSAWENIYLQYHDAMVDAGVEQATHMQALLLVLTREQREQLKQRHEEDEALKQLFRPEN